MEGLTSAQRPEFPALGWTGVVERRPGSSAGVTRGEGTRRAPGSAGQHSSG